MPGFTVPNQLAHTSADETIEPLLKATHASLTGEIANHGANDLVGDDDLVGRDTVSLVEPRQ